MARPNGSRAADSAARAGGADYAVLTPERVALHYDVAGLGSRGAALFVDGVIQGAVLLVLALLSFTLFSPARAAAGVLGGAGRPGAAFWLGIAALVFVAFVVMSGYAIFFEIVWNGQTPGKRLLGIRVIRESGYPIRPRDAVVRHLVGIADGVLTSFVVGPLVMLFNDRAKRLGDFAAGTIVVREGAAQRVASLAALTAEPAGDAARSPGAVALSAEDATLVRDFLLRRSTLDAAARERLAARLAAALAQRYGLLNRRRPQTDESFLEALVAET